MTACASPRGKLLSFVAKVSLAARLVVCDPYADKSYSQEGEDMILRELFRGQPSGFYVDVGAHHPKRFSNTYYFYLRGWRGINIDAMPGCMRAFRRVRPRDINLEAGVARERGELRYFVFSDPALSTFDEQLAKERVAAGRYSILYTRLVQTYPLSEILQAHLPPGQRIDFMSIDVEGFDLQVLLSSDWERFRPRYVLVESLQATEGRGVGRNAIDEFLATQGYAAIARTLRTIFFREEPLNG